MICKKCNKKMINGRKFYICKNCNSFHEIENIKNTKYHKLDFLPIILISPYLDMLNENHPMLKINYSIDFLTNLLKFIALVIQTEYLYSEKNIDEINNMIIEELGRPLVSSWKKFIELALESLDDFFLNDIDLFYNNNKENINKLLQYRNKYAHGITPKYEEIYEDSKEIIRIIDNIVTDCFFLSDYYLIKRYVDKFIILNSYNIIDFDNSDINGKDELRKKIINESLILLNKKNNKYISLLPFFIIPENFISNIENIELLIYDQKNDKRIFYYGEEGSFFQIESVINEWLKLIKQKSSKGYIKKLDNLEINEIDQRIKKNNKEQLRFYRKIGKYSKELFVKRNSINDLIDDYILSNKQILILSGEAGTGKSNISCSILEKKSNIVLLPSYFIQGKDIEKSIKISLKIDNQIALENILNIFTKDLILIIDGINEVLYPSKILNSIHSLIQKHDNIRFIITCRDTSYKRLLSEITKFPLQKYYSTKEYEITTFNYRSFKKYLTENIPLLNVEEINKIYTKLQKNGEKVLGKPHKPKTSFKQISYNKALLNFLNNPLNIKILSYVFNNKKIDDDLSINSLYEKYYDRLLIDYSNSDLENYLFALSSIFIKKNASRLKLQDLLSSPMIRNIIMQNDINSPHRVLLRTGIIYEYIDKEDVTYIRFSYDKIFEYILYKYLDKEDLNDNQIISYVNNYNYHIIKAIELLIFHRYFENRYNMMNFEFFINNINIDKLYFFSNILIELDIKGINILTLIKQLFIICNHNKVLESIRYYPYYLKIKRNQDNLYKLMDLIIENIQIKEVEKDKLEYISEILDSAVVSIIQNGNNDDFINLMDYNIKVVEKLNGSKSIEVLEKRVNFLMSLISNLSLIKKKELLNTYLNQINKNIDIINNDIIEKENLFIDDSRNFQIIKSIQSYFYIILGIYNDLLKKSHDYYDKSIALIHFSENIDKRFVIRVLYAYIYKAKQVIYDSYDEGDKFIKKYLDYSKKIHSDNYKKLGMCFSTAVNIYISTQSDKGLNQGLEISKESLKIFIKYYGEIHPEVFNIKYKIYLILFNLQKFDDINKQINITIQEIEAYYTKPNKLLIDMYELASNIYLYLEEYQKGLEVSKKLYNCFQESRLRKFQIVQKIAQNLEGLEDQSSIDWYLKGLEIFFDNKDYDIKTLSQKDIKELWLYYDDEIKIEDLFYILFYTAMSYYHFKFNNYKEYCSLIKKIYINRPERIKENLKIKKVYEISLSYIEEGV